MHAKETFRLIPIFLLFGFYAVSGQIKADTCRFEDLPTNLNSISYLDLTNEVHIHGEYFANFTLLLHELTFTLTKQSAFRMYVAPHDVDVDMWLYKVANGRETNVASSIKVNTEEVIRKTLEAGDYLVRMPFFGAWIDTYDPKECDTILIELEIVPTTVITSRANAMQCPAQESLPVMSFGRLLDGDNFVYDSMVDDPDKVMNIQGPASDQVSAVRWVTAYNFTVPKVEGATALWKIEATLGSEFLFGGSLGLLLHQVLDDEEKNGATEPSLECFTFNNCTLGMDTRMNENTLRVVVPDGTYRLWIYDAIGEKDDSLASCIPFSFKLSIDRNAVLENFVTCTAPKLPTELLPGLYDEPPGYIHYHANALVDFSDNRHTMTIHTTEESYFRVVTAAHRVDIDLKLTDDRGTNIEYVYQWGSAEEVIVTTLGANKSYNFTIILWGTYEEKFCETMDIEIAVAPKSMFSGINWNTKCGTPVKPNLDGIAAALATANKTYHLDSTTYIFAYNTDYSQREIVSKNFTVTTPSVFKAIVGNEFVLGDISLRLFSPVTTFVGENERNYEILETTLQPGVSYKLQILTGPSKTKSLQNFPPCVEYTFSLHIAPQEADECWRYLSLPSTFNDVQYLGGTNSLHFQDNFLVPLRPGGGWRADQTIKFRVTTDVFFRVYTEPHHIDIDLALYKVGNNTPIASTVKLNEEEEVIAVLPGNQDYYLSVKYYHFANLDNGPDPPCWLFNMELAISPISENGPECTDDLPPQYFIPNYTDGSPSFYFEKSFQFQQTSKSFTRYFPFTVDGDNMIYFRAAIEYDFVWSDLNVRLIANGDFDNPTFGSNEYNRNSLPIVTLPAGNYTLEIYEPSTVVVSSLRRCAPFTLIVGYETAGGIGDQNGLLGCTQSYLPSTLTSPAFLSPLSGQISHFQTEVLVETSSKKDAMAFVLSEPSILAVFVPPLTTLDVDLMVYTGTPKSPGTRLVLKDGLSHEALTIKLDAGKYFLQTRYYGYGGSALPTANCLHFPAEIAVVPTAYLEAIPALTTACTTATPPSTMQYGEFEYNLKRRMPEAYKTMMSFSVPDVAILNFDLRYDTPSGGLMVTMVGVIDEGLSQKVNRTYQADYGFNHAWIHRILEKGDYYITIEDPYTTQTDMRDTNLKCSAFTVTYLLNATQLPSDYCDDTQQLPSDLYSTAGGSAPYGGPQDASDGSIRLYGEKFALNIDEGRDHYVRFKVKKGSYIRMFAKADADTDVDFFIYNNVTRPPGSMKYMSIGTASVESALIKVEPQTDDYLLDLYVFDTNEDQVCPYFTFAFALKTNDTVRQELLCPAQLPEKEVPDPTINVNGYTLVFSPDYIFTATRMRENTNNNLFTYRITVRTHGNTTIHSAVGYDFLANDFRLILRDSSSKTIASGVSGGTEQRGDYVNFENALFHVVGEGTYYLDIVEDLSQKKLGLTEYCHRFSFYFLGLSDSTTPMVDSIQPPSGTNINPFEDLVLNIAFSEAVSVPQGNLVTWITSNRAVYLTPTSDASSKIYPAVASFKSSNTVLNVIFSKTSLSQGTSYRLQLDASKFKTLNNAAFSLPDDDPQHVYIMKSCDCNGHGTCDDSNGKFVCTCQTGYDGDDCSACAKGYHAVAGNCVVDEKCAANSCNGHGRCYDSTGVIQCVCSRGYASVQNNYCTVCASGYAGYPNCTSSSSEIDRSTVCSAPLLPTSLDSIEYLGFNRAVHLQDDYYVDLDYYVHDMVFTLYEDSLLRAYTEPHWVDVDMWLYRVNENNTVTLITNAIAINTEETIFQLLAGNAIKPPKYRLRLRYYVWDTVSEEDTQCETVNFELAIAPVATVVKEAQQISQDCSATNNLPAVPGFTQGVFKEISSLGLAFPAGTKEYTLRAENRTTYFVGYDFQIAENKDKVAYLNAEVGYKFLAGQLGLLLETGSKRSHCSSKGGSDSKCIAGYNQYNRNTIHEMLNPGNYTLWIYQPEFQNTSLTTCSLFTFELSIGYVDLMEDIFYCDATTFPVSFNSPGYLDSQGKMHFKNTYLLEATTISFTLAKKSNLRVHASSDIALSLAILNSNGNSLKSSWTNTYPQLFTQLAAGQYKLKISPNAQGTRCPVVTIEMAIAPDATISNPCSHEDLPNPTINTFPFYFGQTDEESPEPPRYFTYLTQEVIKEFTFNVEQLSKIEVLLSSDFLTGALEVVLEDSQQNSKETRGVVNFNQYVLRKEVEPRLYTIKILRPESTSQSTIPATFPDCVEFNLAISIVPKAQLGNCLSSGEDLPTSFNSIRFLTLENQFDFQSPSIRVPSFDSFLFRRIKFKVTTASIFRMYTEPHVVDIDLALYEEGQMSPIISGGYSFNNEESIAYLLDPSKTYFAELAFWKWDTNIPACPEFNLEVSIVPVTANPLVTQCPNGRDNWVGERPPTTGLPNPPYIYNSEEKGDDLYFQQRYDGTRKMEPPMDFTLSEVTNLYAELGYDFATGDLVMRLYHHDSKTTYYGYNTYNGNVLKLVGLPIGNYTLYIYEAVVGVKDYLGCSHFKFYLRIEPDSSSQLVDPQPVLPYTLDTIPFLRYNGAVHIQGYFLMFASAETEKVLFKITTPSLLRVSTTHYINELQDVQVVLLKNGSPYAAAMDSITEQLDESGSYTIQFNRPLGASLPKMYVDVELAIAPNSVIQEEISKPPYSDTHCADSKIPNIVVSPNSGQYNYYNSSLQFSADTKSSKTTLQTLEFELTKESAAYFRLGFNYLLGDLDLQLTGTKAQTNEEVEAYGLDGRNINELNVLLPAGTYQLAITQPEKMTVFPHCAIYSFTAIIKPSSGDDTHVDCSALSLVPWNLNSPNGGSVPYGGPMDNTGSLHMVGTSFLMPTQTKATDSMFVNVTKPSMMVVIAQEEYLGGMSCTTYKYLTGSKNLTEPLLKTGDGAQMGQLYMLDVTGSLSQYEIQLGYHPPTRVACPYFALQVLIQPLDAVARALVCPTNPKPKLPIPLVDAKDKNGVYVDYQDSFFTTSYMNDHVINGKFTYNVNLTVYQTSNVVASISYNGLANMFLLSLFRVTGTKESSIGSGSWVMERTQSGKTNINQVLSGKLPQGNYTLRITESRASLPFADERCVPFIYQLRVLPDTGVLYVVNVQPPGGENFAPDKVLELQVTFSDTAYAQDQVVGPTNFKPVMDALYLYGSADKITVAPIAAVGDGINWRVIFPPSFKTKESYLLQVRDGILVDRNKASIQLVGTYKYTMIDTQCNNHGTYDRGYCFCEVGYAGSTCELCNVGYKDVSTDSSKMDCQATAGDVCMVDSCGCDPNSPQGTCTPLGTCTEVDGKPVCQCNSHYAGPKCDQCADGYENYEAGCPQSDKCPTCVHGKCNTKTRLCECDDKYSGSTCAECAPGWGGQNCDQAITSGGYAPPTPTKSGAIEAISIIGIVLAVVAVVGTVGFMLYRRFGKNFRGYRTVDLDMSELADYEEDGRTDD